MVGKASLCQTATILHLREELSAAIHGSFLIQGSDVCESFLAVRAAASDDGTLIAAVGAGERVLSGTQIL